MKQVVFLTGSELRHTYVRKCIAHSSSFKVIASYCEGLEKSLDSLFKEGEASEAQRKHLDARLASEKKFFGSFVQKVDDASAPQFISKGAINEPTIVNEIIESAPDLLLAYGCSLIKGELLKEFSGRFINVHLGLSPYYRGSGTNFWPLVNGEPEYIGATFMYMDEGIDTGQIIHQIRARVFIGDSIHDIGNRLIQDVAVTFQLLVRHWSQLKNPGNLKLLRPEKYYRKKDFTAESVHQLRRMMESKVIENYLIDKDARDGAAPILQNPLLIMNPEEAIS